MTVKAYNLREHAKSSDFSLSGFCWAFLVTGKAPNVYLDAQDSNEMLSSHTGLSRLPIMENVLGDVYLDVQ